MLLHILILLHSSFSIFSLCEDLSFAPYSPGHYQDYSPYGNTASSQYIRGFADWGGTRNNALMSLAHATTFGSGSNSIISNGIHQNFTSYNTHTWTATYMPRNPYNTAYGPATMNMMLQTPSFHSNSLENDSGIYTYIACTFGI
jgi:hypothetical protein